MSDDGYIYVVSDIHGNINRYKTLLEVIDFKSTDKLIVVGDVIDRGNDGVQILLDIMKYPNIELILGNHELMMLDALECKRINKYGDNFWFDVWTHKRNGGKRTMDSLEELRKTNETVYNELIQYVKSAKYEITVEIKDKLFYFVHGGPYGSDVTNNFTDYEHNVTWNRLKAWQQIREERRDNNENPRLCTVIVGHTPTGNYNKKYLADLSRTYKIYYGNGWIDIDCGCAITEDPNTYLGCLRLNDMQEFYISDQKHENDL